MKNTFLKPVSLLLTIAAFFITGQLFAQPDIEVTPGEHDYGEVIMGDYANYYFTFSNTGDETIHISDITFTDPAFSIQYTQFDIAPGESGQLPVKFHPTQALFYNAKMHIYSNDPDENPFVVYLSGKGVAATIDGWEWINTGFDYILTDIEFPCGQSKIGFAVGQKNTYNGEGIVIKTTDGGSTWTQTTDSGTVWLTAISFVDTLTGYVGGLNNNILKTTDGGNTWSQVNFPFADEVYRVMDVEFRDANHGVVGVIPNYGETPHVYITNDGGSTWIKSNGFEIVSTYMIEYINDSTLVAVGGQEVISKSTDGGLNWQTVYVGEYTGTLIGVDFLNENHGLVVGDYGHVYQTDDGGLNWNTVDYGGGDDLLHTPYIWDEDTTWIVGTPELIYKTTDGGNTWQNAYNGNYQRAFYRITFTDNYTGYICASHGVILRKKGFPEIPGAEIAPTSLNYGEINPGDTLVKSFKIKNTGFGLLKISNMAISNEAFSADLSDFSIRPRHEKVVNVTFTANESGDYTGELTFNTNDTTHATVTISLSGNVAELYPEIFVAPDSLEFGEVAVNESAAQILKVSNIGDNILHVSDITTGDDAFSVDITSFDLNPGESYNVNVTFLPEAEQEYSTTVNIASDDPDNPTLQIPVTGTGVIYSPQISVEPMSIDFDTVYINESSMQVVTVTNTGNILLNVTNIYSSNDAFTVNEEYFALLPGEQQEVEITFAPTSAGDYTGAIVFESNDPDNGNVEVSVHGYCEVETGINATSEKVSNIFPNPAKDIIYVTNAKDKEIRIYNMSGKLVYYTISGSDRQSLNVSSFNSGMYIINITDNKGNKEVHKIKIQL